MRVREIVGVNRSKDFFMMIGCLLWLGGVDNLYRTMIFIFIVFSLLLFKFNDIIYINII